MIDDNRKIGIGLTLLGSFFTTIGVVLFLDRALLAFGNICFLAGLCFLLGTSKTGKFFFRREKARGTTLFFGGFALILFGWPLFGLIAEAAGVWFLFAAFLPNIIASVKLTSFGWIFNLPGLRQATEWVYDQRRLPV